MSVPIRLILFASQSIKPSDVHTFKNAAKTVADDYKKHYPSDTVLLKGFSNGKELVRAISSQNDKSIYSLDVVSHGNQGGIHIAKKLSPPEKSPVAKAYYHHQLRGRNGLNLDPQYPQTKQDAEFMEESMHGLYTNNTVATWVSRYYNQKLIKKQGILSDEYMEGIATIGEIPFSRFVSGAFVEFHGCRAAEKIPYLNDIFDNFTKDFADKMPSESIVVGHTTNNFPNNHPGGRKNDYRHNKIRVYQAGWYSSSALYDEKPIERWGKKFQNSSTPPAE